MTPPFWTHVNPYGQFRLDMDTQVDLAATDLVGARVVETAEPVIL